MCQVLRKVKIGYSRIFGVIILSISFVATPSLIVWAVFSFCFLFLV